MKKIALVLGAALAAFSLVSCGSTKVDRYESGSDVKDLSGYWNENDIKQVCEELISGCIASPRVTGFKAANRATTYYNLGMYDKAIEDSNYAIELSPRTAKYYLRKGMAHLQLGQLYAAKLAFQNGLKQEPGNDKLREALSERRPGEPQYTGEFGRYSWEQKREQALEFKNQGNKAFQAKNYTLAIERYTEAIKYDPTDPVFYTNRAACYTELKQYDEAISDCKLAVALGEANGVSNLGQTHLLENRLFAKTYMRMAIAYEKLNKFKEAHEAAQTGLGYEQSAALTELATRLASKAN